MITHFYYRFIKPNFEKEFHTIHFRIKLLGAFLLVTTAFTMNSCSTDSTNAPITGTSLQKSTINYIYNSSELETMALINTYRSSIGLKALEQNNYISYKSEEHDNYMISNNTISHDNFVARSENIIETLHVQKVVENVAYNYNSSQAVFAAWLNSPVHKANIEGDYTYFGVSIRENSEGVKYYTNVFAK